MLYTIGYLVLGVLLLICLYFIQKYYIAYKESELRYSVLEAKSKRSIEELELKNVNIQIITKENENLKEAYSIVINLLHSLPIANANKIFKSNYEIKAGKVICRIRNSEITPKRKYVEGNLYLKHSTKRLYVPYQLFMTDKDLNPNRLLKYIENLEKTKK